MTDQAFIALLGETGSGKTTFVNRAIENDAFLVGNGLRSCTSEIQVSPEFAVDGHPVFLIDTPGFNDTVMEDVEVLEKISAFLATVYQTNVKLAGIIYFHRISDERWRKSDTRSFGWLKGICGERTLRNVVLMTNMWGNVDPIVGAAREQQLAAEFVKPALDQGARFLRHYNTTESAHDIIREILKNRRTALQVQEELVDEGREFDQTTLGGGINREVEESTRRLERRVEELQNALATAKYREGEIRSRLEAEVVGLVAEIKRLTELSGNMNAGYKEKKAKADKLWDSLRLSAVVGISTVLLWGLYYCLRVYI